MMRWAEGLSQRWRTVAPALLPFADVASEDLPLSRLLRLSLFQFSVGMAVVLLSGTLNRVMIVELGIPAALVAIMVALPLLAAPFRALCRRNIPGGWPPAVKIHPGAAMHLDHSQSPRRDATAMASEP